METMSMFSGMSDATAGAAEYDEDEDEILDENISNHPTSKPFDLSRSKSMNYIDSNMKVSALVSNIFVYLLFD